jgi:hypothetical protein
LFIIRETPVTAAAVYPPILYHGFFHPYSIWSIVADMNAVAVCPEGKELYALPSGRSLPTEYLMPFTVAAMMATENASLTNIRLQEELRPSIPYAFIPTVSITGAYCR